MRKVLTLFNPDIIVHGNARGADALADIVGHGMGKEIRRYPADWERYKKGAGPIRNAHMLQSELEGLDLVIAFPGGTGTADMVTRAREAGVPVKEISER